MGEDHRILNNYFERLGGEEARSALCLMNGLPESPLHGYFQVQRAVTAFNTFVDCRSSLLIGLVSDNPKGGILAPADCMIANNIIQSAQGPLVRLASAPENFAWRQNWMHGAALGIPPQEGILSENPRLRRAADGIWRPDAASPVIDAAAGDFPFVETDIDSQPRSGHMDTGCDEVSAPAVTRRTLEPADVSPEWSRPGDRSVPPKR